MNSDKNPYRELPSIDWLLQQLAEEIKAHGRTSVTSVARALIGDLRESLASGKTIDSDIDSLRTAIHARLEAAQSSTLFPVFNLTGTVLHTNLGRALLPEEALLAMSRVASVNCNLEYDVEQGARGDRDSHVEALLCELTGAEAATVVNNNAAAVLLVLNSLAQGREVPVSRGELVEIGGSFRIPEVMARSGCTLVEVGATNRTHLKDYQQALSNNTALLMKVHTSNYVIEGFTHTVADGELAALAHEHNLPLVIDLGSGNLADFEALGLPREQTVTESLRSGADLVTFSGDKLLGGPQAGIIAGRADLIASVKSNPLKRALRSDKMTLAALVEVLKLYRDPDQLTRRLPTLRLLTRDVSEIKQIAEALLAPVQAAVGAKYVVSVQACSSQIGSGSLPLDCLPSAALHIVASEAFAGDVRELASALRRLPRPVIGRIHKNALWLDLRCLEEDQQQLFADQLPALFA